MVQSYLNSSPLHNNYYFLRQLSKRIETELKDTVVSECFSQSKEELIIRFEKGRNSHYIKATLLPSFSCISFPPIFHRARKNSVDLFEKLVGQKLLRVRQFENERSFALCFTDNMTLLFKMHGTRSNVILFEQDNIVDLFKKNLIADHQVDLSALDREIDWSYENFVSHQQNLSKVYFTFGKTVWDFLRSIDFDDKPIGEKWTVIQNLKSILEEPHFFVTEVNDVPILSLIKYGRVLKNFDDPVKAVNEFYYTYTQVFALAQEKSAVMGFLNQKLQSSRNYIKKTASKLSEIQADTNYKVWADLIMANLHTIKPGTEKITLKDFYLEDHYVDIRLKKDQSAQRNAEIFYKKGKNQKIEIEHLQQAIAMKEKEIKETEAHLSEIMQTNDLKSLREKRVMFGIDLKPQKETENLPYHEFIFNGYRIWVGRNAEGNDTLTLKFGYKEDLWLHAKDVPGSHVLIKHQAGKNFPKDVIQRAAELAAYNSKRKTESLCPVIVTPKKFVRKRKGDPAGAVVVEREQVIMVEPKL
jgi:predicted ribosome quality control (RQC) complex YloA/Tae2 family protein